MGRTRPALTNDYAFAVAEKINKLRMEIKGKAFSPREFQALLKEYGLYSGGVFWSVLINYEIISLVGKAEYAFTNPRAAVHWKLAKGVIQAYYDRSSQYNKKNEDKKGPSPRVLKAVQFLKSYGFEIYAPAGNNLFEKL